jgi:hypothetical protein
VADNSDDQERGSDSEAKPTASRRRVLLQLGLAAGTAYAAPVLLRLDGDAEAAKRSKKKKDKAPKKPKKEKKPKSKKESKKPKKKSKK